MKRVTAALLAFLMILSLSACGQQNTATGSSSAPDNVPTSGLSTPEMPDSTPSENTEPTGHVPVAINPSPDKYTWYIKDYVGKNVASFGYTSMGGDRRDTYGASNLLLILVAEDGSYIDIENEDELKEYVVTAQDLEPNTELKLVFAKDSNGEEYGYLLEHQTYERIALRVKKVGATDSGSPQLTPINPSPDKYTWYIADYVGRNLASCGYLSMGGDYRDAYGSGSVKLIINTDDGSFVDPKDSESLRGYVVMSQNIAPNTELKFEFKKASDGTEYNNLIDSQSIQEIELFVKKLDG